MEDVETRLDCDGTLTTEGGDEFNGTDEVNVWTEDDESRLDCDGTLTIECGNEEGK